MLCHVFPFVCLFRHVLVVFVLSGHVRSVRRLPLPLPGFFLPHLFPIITLIVCLICSFCVLLIPLVCFTCVLSLFPLLFKFSLCVPYRIVAFFEIRVPGIVLGILIFDLLCFAPLDILIFDLLCFFPFLEFCFAFWILCVFPFWKEIKPQVFVRLWSAIGSLLWESLTGGE